MHIKIPNAYKKKRRAFTKEQAQSRNKAKDKNPEIKKERGT